MEKKQIINIPATRDPFINAMVVPAGKDKETDQERFWCSTWNSNSGCTGALVTVSGKSKVFRFDYNKKQFGFYGASYAEDDIMWMTGFLDEVVMLDLNTGETQSWNTGLPHALSFGGMIYDSKTGKIFSSAYCQEDFTRKAFSFDTKKGEVAARYMDLPLKNNYVKYSIKNNDGTYTLVCMQPGVELLLWDPVEERVEVISESYEIENQGHCAPLIQREDGALYIPYIGWFDPCLKKAVEGPKALHETAWFGLKDNIAYGSEYNASGNSTLYKWNLSTGDIEKITDIPDALSYSFQLTSDGKIICINMYGFFYRIDPQTSAIECSKKMDTDAVGAIDCLYRINEERLLCTPFITQRFYEINIKTGKGYDLGRATGGSGEVLKVAELNNKIYMASYTKGQLVEYDPELPAYFPENPRIVVQPPHGAMRPVAMCTDKDSIYYSCSHEYGNLGSILTKYTPSEGDTLFVDNPIPDQMICSMLYDDKEILLVGTTYHADCRSCLPKAERCVVAELNVKSLLPDHVLELPDIYERAEVHGKLCKEKYLCCFMNSKGRRDWAIFNTAGFDYELIDLREKISCKDPDKNSGIQGVEAPNRDISVFYTGKPGMFIVRNEESIELWNLGSFTKLRNICHAKGFYRLYVQDNILYLVYRDEIHVYNDVI